MLLSLRINGLTSLFKEVRVFKAFRNSSGVWGFCSRNASLEPRRRTPKDPAVLKTRLQRRN